jgi:hypothetical protein
VVDLNADVSIHVMSVGRFRPDSAIAFASIPVLALIQGTAFSSSPSSARPLPASHRHQHHNMQQQQYIELVPFSSALASSGTAKGQGSAFLKYRPAQYVGNEPPSRPDAPLGVIQVASSVVLATNDNYALANLGAFVSSKVLGSTSASLLTAYTHPRYAAVDASNDDSAQAIVASASRLIRALARIGGPSSPFRRSLTYVREWHSVPVNLVTLALLYFSCFDARWAHLPIVAALVLVACGVIDSWEERKYVMWGPPEVKLSPSLRVPRDRTGLGSGGVVKGVVHKVWTS